VADVGAGTGKLTRQLTGSGADIVAVEPVAEMRAQFARVLPEMPILEGRAEALPLPDASLDAIVAGQAWHWFDADAALQEAARVLVSGGGLGLIWNDYDMSVLWVRELAQIRDRFAPPDRSSGWKEVFANHPNWTPLEDRAFSHEHQTTRDAVVDRVLSTSVIAALSPEEREAVRREVLDVLGRHEETRGRGELLVPYRTEVYWTFLR
jgi:SAM-dependent methyltransferase